MKRPRELATTLPSPSEMDNWQKCKCAWWLNDRLWIKPVSEIMPFLVGRALDYAFDALFKRESGVADLVPRFLDYTHKHIDGKFPQDKIDAFLVSTVSAINAWVTLYGSVEENVIAVQPKLPEPYRAKPDYVVETVPGLVRVRERKLVSPFADLDLEIAKYQLGLQPLAYAAWFEQCSEAILGRQVAVECVEFEFFVRSAPGKGKYKERTAAVRREPIYVTDEKKRMVQATAEFENAAMQMLSEALLTSYEGSANVPFAVLPRSPRSCLTKVGKDTYFCDYYKACATLTSPAMLPEDFTCELEDEHGDEAETTK